SMAERLASNLRNAEAAAREGLQLGRSLKDPFQESVGCQYLGLISAVRGAVGDAQSAFTRAERLSQANGEEQLEGTVRSYRAEYLTRISELDSAQRDIERAEELAVAHHHAQDLIRVNRLQGTVALRRGDLASADGRLTDAHSRCRAC